MQDVRAGDTLALDYKVWGLHSLPRAELEQVCALHMYACKMKCMNMMQECSMNSHNMFKNVRAFS